MAIHFFLYIHWVKIQYYKKLLLNNDAVSKTLTILSGELVPIYPYEFMIVPDDSITLVASTAFPFEPAKDYLFEIL